MRHAFENSCIKGCTVYLVALVLLIVVSAAGIGGLSKKFGAVAQGTGSVSAFTTTNGAEPPAGPAATATPQPQVDANLPGFVFGIATKIAAPAATTAPAPSAPTQNTAPSSAPPPVAQPPASTQSSYAPQTQAQGGDISGQSLAPFYIVQGGDTLSEIAARFGTDSQSLREINKLDDANSIWPGQLLYLPGGEPAPQSQAQPQAGAVSGETSAPTPVGTDSQGGANMPTMPNTGINSRP